MAKRKKNPLDGFAPTLVAILKDCQRVSVSEFEKSFINFDADNMYALNSDNQLTHLCVNEKNKTIDVSVIFNSVHLVALRLSQCGLSQLPESVGQLGSLTKLNVSSNMLSELPASFLKLQNLIELYLH